MDIISTEARSRLMARIGGRNTVPELAVRSTAHAMGLRFRLHGKGLPGRPDLVFRRHAAVIFVHGCFWHRHGCKLATTPSTNRSYWLPKFERNKMRDERCIKELETLGWRVLVIWECETRQPDVLKYKLAQFFGL